MLLGKSLTYSLLELFRPNEKEMPSRVAEILDSFHLNSDDIDDLVLGYQDLVS